MTFSSKTKDMQDLSNWVKNNFAFLDEISVKTLREYTNDVFEVENGRKHLLKIYGDNWKTKSEVLWEIELLEYLKSHDVNVAGAVEGKRGEKLFNLDIDDTERIAVMFEWAPGEKPNPPFSIDDYELLGKATARVHEVSNNFRSNQHRQKLDMEYLIDSPLLIISSTCHSEDKIEYFHNLANRLRDYIQEYVVKGLDWGVVHADVSFDNIHIIDDREIVFYDFDSGGLGWRAIDLQGWAVFEPQTAHRQTAFIKGYRTEREISKNDISASPYIHAANEFWGVGLDLSRRISKLGERSVELYLDEKIVMFKKFLKYFES